MGLVFEWDDEKDEANRKKHKVGFDEAKTVFNDPYAITMPDEEHATNESRYIDIGLSSKGQLLVVVYTERETTIRLISSRKATKWERRVYEEGISQE